MQSPQLLQHNSVHISFAFRQKVLNKMKIRWTESPTVMQWQPCCSTEIFYSLVLGRPYRVLREETTIGDEQFGVMPGRGTTDAIFAVRQHNGETSGKTQNTAYVIYRPRKGIEKSTIECLVKKYGDV